jgi:hypothetical protein
VEDFGQECNNEASDDLCLGSGPFQCVGADHIPSEITPLPCPVIITPTLIPPPVVVSLDVGNFVTTTQPLPSTHTTFVAKAVTDDLLAQHGVE